MPGSSFAASGNQLGDGKSVNGATPDNLTDQAASCPLPPSLAQRPERACKDNVLALIRGVLLTPPHQWLLNDVVADRRQNQCGR